MEDLRNTVEKRIEEARASAASLPRGDYTREFMVRCAKVLEDLERTLAGDQERFVELYTRCLRLGFEGLLDETLAFVKRGRKGQPVSEEELRNLVARWEQLRGE